MRALKNEFAQPQYFSFVLQMAVHALILHLLPEMAEKVRIGASFDSPENVLASVIKFNKGLAAFAACMREPSESSSFDASRPDTAVFEKAQDELDSNGECLSGVASVMCHYINVDWSVDYRRSDHINSLIIAIVLKLTKDERIADAAKAMLDMYDSIFDREIHRDDWNDVLSYAESTGNVPLAKLARAMQ